MKVKELIGFLTQEGVNPESQAIFYCPAGENCVIDLEIAELAVDDDGKKTFIELHEAVNE